MTADPVKTSPRTVLEKPTKTAPSLAAVEGGVVQETGRLAFNRRHLSLRPRLAWRLVRISLGGIGQFLIATSSWIVIMRIVAIYGSAAIAAYTIALRLIEFVFLPAWGLGNAAATLVGLVFGWMFGIDYTQSLVLGTLVTISYLVVAGALGASAVLAKASTGPLVAVALIAASAAVGRRALAAMRKTPGWGVCSNWF